MCFFIFNKDSKVSIFPCFHLEILIIIFIVKLFPVKSGKEIGLLEIEEGKDGERCRGLAMSGERQREGC